MTGAAGDFGRAVAVALATAGASVVLADRPEMVERLAANAELCRLEGPTVEVHTAEFDVTDTEAVARQIAAIGRDVGPIEVLVNNAGYQGEFANVADYPLDDLRRVLDVNVVGAFAVLQAVAQQMIASGGGAIVNVASMAGASGAVNMPAYSASKAAISGLTRAAAKDLAPHQIRVNAVSPGFIGPGAMWERQVAEQARVQSPYYADSPTDVAQQMVGSVPLGRYGSVDEVIASILFLLSDGAGFITGVDLEISGGGR